MTQHKITCHAIPYIRHNLNDTTRWKPRYKIDVHCGAKMLPLWHGQAEQWVEDHWSVLEKLLPTEVADFGKKELRQGQVFLEGIEICLHWNVYKICYNCFADLATILPCCSKKIRQWLQGHLEQLNMHLKSLDVFKIFIPNQFPWFLFLLCFWSLQTERLQIRCECYSTNRDMRKLIRRPLANT